jgi:hypothetical protein
MTEPDGIPDTEVHASEIAKVIAAMIASAISPVFGALVSGRATT